MSFDFLVSLALVVMQTGFYLMTIVCQPAKQRRLLCIVFFVALLYPVGEMLQEIHTVPEIIRWHLSDLGFVPCEALTVYTFAGIFNLVWRGVIIRVADYFASTRAILVHVCLIGLVLCSVTVYELLADNTDMIDILMYFTGAAIALVVYKKLWASIQSTSIIEAIPSTVG